MVPPLCVGGSEVVAAVCQLFGEEAKVGGSDAVAGTLFECCYSAEIPYVLEDLVPFKYQTII